MRVLKSFLAHLFGNNTAPSQNDFYPFQTHEPWGVVYDFEDAFKKWILSDASIICDDVNIDALEHKREEYMTKCLAYGERDVIDSEIGNRFDFLLKTGRAYQKHVRNETLSDEETAVIRSYIRIYGGSLPYFNDQRP